jgi:hypothetical protein
LGRKAGYAAPDRHGARSCRLVRRISAAELDFELRRQLVIALGEDAGGSALIVGRNVGRKAGLLLVDADRDVVALEVATQDPVEPPVRGRNDVDLLAVLLLARGIFLTYIAVGPDRGL